MSTIPNITLSRMPRFIFFVILLLSFAGCYNFDKRTDSRTALEQQLTRTAIARAIDQLAIHKDVLEGKWKLEVAAPDKRDRDWILSYLRRRLTILGAHISRDPKNTALPIIEVGVVNAGSDIDNFYIGIPLPGTGNVLGFINSISERGRARISLTFWNQNGTILAQTNEVVGSAYYKSIWYLTFFGPFGYTDLDVQMSGRFTESAKENWNQVKEAGDWIVPDVIKPPSSENE